jgi:transcriptional regulator with GAF, ATPase, and Fis domain
VLVLGETGTGKESVARIVHQAYGGERPFIGLNIAALPPPLFETELFGHERGAFTGASVSRSGAFRDADGGVLFLDEIADLQPELQVKLLRALDLKSVRPVGANRDVRVDVRLVSATSQDLERARDEGRFRDDLYFRLAGLVIEVPPLRTRPDDIVLLAQSILANECRSLLLSSEAAERLVLGSWNGNARELRSAVMQAATKLTGANHREVRARHLPDVVVAEASELTLTAVRIRHAMVSTRGVVSKAAESLGVSRTAFYNACRRFGIETSTLRTTSASEG